MPNVYFLQGAPVSDADMAKKTSIQGALYLSNDVSGNSNSNRLYIGRTNAVGGIKPIVTPTPFKQIIKLNGKTEYTFNGTEDITINITPASIDAATSNHALSMGSSTATSTLSPSSTFTAITGITVSGHKITPTTTTYTLPPDTKVTNTLNTTIKAYITGTTSTNTNTGTQVFDTGVYLGTIAGRLETGSLTVGATSSSNGKCALVYDTTNECVNFVFQ